MAKKIKVMEPPPIWVEPPVTKEEALNPPAPSGGWQPDGFDGGSELPADLDIDRLIFPHDEGPLEKAANERQAKREAEAEVFQKERFDRSREFRIDQGNVTGQNPGPPSSFGKKED